MSTITETRSWRRVVRLTVGIVLGAILGLYAIFAVGLLVLEALVEKNPTSEEAVSAHSRAPHSLTLYDSGLLSLKRRLELIASAKKTIELEFFIYDVDQASRLLTQALVKKASEGVKVRILVDFSSPVFQLKPIYARFLKERGIDVRYYNTSSVYRILSIQHRSHRKLLIIDGETALTGGRNIANDYFDLGDQFSFLDSDVEVSGPIVRKILTSFDLYWGSKLASTPENISLETTLDEKQKATSFFLPQGEDQIVLNKLLATLRDPSIVLAKFECRDLSFVTDFPNHGEKNRKVYQAITETLATARKNVVAESPYFVLRGEGLPLLDRLHQQGVQVDVLTNSLHSTDAWHAVAALFSALDPIARTGAHLHAFDGSFIEGQSTSLSGRLHRWGIHSKRAVIDGKTVLIGTYNIDPRSANLNSELMLICRDNEALAKAVLDSIHKRMANSTQITKDGQTISYTALLEGSSFLQRAVFVALIPLSWLFDFLL